MARRSRAQFLGPPRSDATLLVGPPRSNAPLLLVVNPTRPGSEPARPRSAIARPLAVTPRPSNRRDPAPSPRVRGAQSRGRWRRLEPRRSARAKWSQAPPQTRLGRQAVRATARRGRCGSDRRNRRLVALRGRAGSEPLQVAAPIFRTREIRACGLEAGFARRRLACRRDPGPVLVGGGPVGGAKPLPRRFYLFGWGVIRR